MHVCAKMECMFPMVKQHLQYEGTYSLYVWVWRSMIYVPPWYVIYKYLCIIDILVWSYIYAIAWEDKKSAVYKYTVLMDGCQSAQRLNKTWYCPSPGPGGDTQEDTGVVLSHHLSPWLPPPRRWALLPTAQTLIMFTLSPQPVMQSLFEQGLFDSFI